MSHGIVSIARPTGEAWVVERASEKLRLRARLPGARVFDLAAVAERAAKAAGVRAADRLALAWPASWLVNSPAPSSVFRRWALEPDRGAWVTLVERLECLETAPVAWPDPAADDAFAALAGGLTEERAAPHAKSAKALDVVEAITKVLALLVPGVVPLAPAPARAFVLGADADGAGPAAFGAMVAWFAGATRAHAAALAAIARAHAEVELTGAQVLDRLLWFDSEGFRHF
jgi:hypothetical protein